MDGGAALGQLSGFAKGEAWIGKWQPGHGGLYIRIQHVAMVADDQRNAGATQQVEIAVKAAHVEAELFCERNAGLRPAA